MRLEELMASAERLPSLPRVLKELIAAFDKPDPDVNHIVALIGSDPTLAAKVLKVANSAFFKRARSIGSLKEAVVFMGLHTTRMLILGSGMAGAVHFLDRETRTQFWRYSLHTAVVARHFARLSRLDGDIAFTAGLIHAIGEPLLAEAFEATLKRLDEQAAFYDGQRIALERLALGFGFPDVGALLSEQWNFPPEVTQAIRAAPDPFHNERFSPLGACVHLAMQMAGSIERAETPDIAFSMLDTRLTVALQLNMDAVRAMPAMNELTEGLHTLVA